MFWLLVLSAWTLLHVYVFWRAASVPAIARRVPARWMALAALILWASLFLARYLGRGGKGSLSAVAEFAAMDWLALLFLTATALLAVDFATGFGLFFRGAAPALRGWALLAGLLLSLFATFQALRPPEVTRYEVTLPNLPARLDGTVAVAVSDLHLGSLIGPGWLDARASQILELHPDLILILGDVVEGHGRPPADFAGGFRRLTAPLGVWAVAGNHEAHGPEDRTVQLLRDCGIRVLTDRCEEVGPGLVVGGLESRHSRRTANERPEALRSVLSACPSGTATILLVHVPPTPAEAAASGAGLILAGHTHAGQIWPFGYLVRLAHPVFSGRYLEGRSTVLVTRGTGTWGPRMRLWSPGEILRITLRSPRGFRPERP